MRIDSDLGYLYDDINDVLREAADWAIKKERVMIDFCGVDLLDDFFSCIISNIADSFFYRLKDHYYIIDKNSEEGKKIKKVLEEENEG